jgi:hypothetical protein
MPSNKSAAEKVREERELARKDRKYYLIVSYLSFRWLISFSSSCSLQHVSSSQGCQCQQQDERQRGQRARPVFL